MKQEFSPPICTLQKIVFSVTNWLQKEAVHGFLDIVKVLVPRLMSPKDWLSLSCKDGDGLMDRFLQPFIR